MGENKVPGETDNQHQNVESKQQTNLLSKDQKSIYLQTLLAANLLLTSAKSAPTASD